MIHEHAPVQGMEFSDEGFLVQLMQKTGFFALHPSPPVFPLPSLVSLMTLYVCCWIGFPIVFSSLPFTYMFINQREWSLDRCVDWWLRCHVGACQKRKISVPTPDLLRQDLHIEKIPRFFSKHIKIEKHHFIPISFQECKMDKVIPAQPTLFTALN